MSTIRSGVRTGVVQSATARLDTAKEEKITTQWIYLYNSKSVGVPGMGPGEGAIQGLIRSTQLDGKWSKTWNVYGRVLIKGTIRQMTLCHVITGIR